MNFIVLRSWQRSDSAQDRLVLDTQVAILNAADYGAPQTRKRTVVVGWERESHRATRHPPRIRHMPPETAVYTTCRYGEPYAMSSLISMNPEARKFVMPKHLITFTSDEIRQPPVWPLSGSTTRRQSIRSDEERTAHHTCLLDSKDVRRNGSFRASWWDRPSVTIRTEFFKPEKGRYLHPDRHRPITHREAARLMGFPDDFVFLGSKTEIARQIGNAVPPDLAWAIAKMVLATLKAKPKRFDAGLWRLPLARRSQPNDRPEQLRSELVDLLQDFAEKLQHEDLRAKVRALVPAFHKLRDLGSSLIPKTDAAPGVTAYLPTYANIRPDH